MLLVEKNESDETGGSQTKLRRRANGPGGLDVQKQAEAPSSSTRRVWQGPSDTYGTRITGLVGGTAAVKRYLAHKGFEAGTSIYNSLIGSEKTKEIPNDGL